MSVTFLTWRCLALAGVIFAATAVVEGSGSAAAIDLGQKGPFEVCLEGAFDKWLKEKAEAVVNEDPAVRNLNDEAVAAWTVKTLDDCRARAGAATPASQDRFENHMARWRQHIYDLASSIRRSGQSD